MKAKLFQKDNEPYFWTINQLSCLQNDDKHKKLNGIYCLSDIEIEVTNENLNNNPIFIDDGINIILFENTMLFENFVSTFKSNYKFLFVIKTIEDYWGCLRHEQEKLYNYIESSNNIKVISDISELKLKNVIFNSKTHIQNYYNFSYAFPCDLFLYGYDVFNIINKEKRIGVHFNKVVDVIRRELVERLYDIENDNLFFTVNKDAYDNEKLSVKTNYETPIFNSNLQKYGLPYHSYIDSYFNLNLKSEMEFIYETFTTVSHDFRFIKWTEKTIKHLYLGKPFIHIDPIAHGLMKKNNMIPYKSLFTNELWDFYENFDTNTLLKNVDFTWCDLLIANFNWLLQMDTNEWKERITEANKVAKINRETVINLIFNTTLTDYIKNYELL